MACAIKELFIVATLLNWKFLLISVIFNFIEHHLAAVDVSTLFLFDIFNTRCVLLHWFKLQNRSCFWNKKWFDLYRYNGQGFDNSWVSECNRLIASTVKIYHRRNGWMVSEKIKRKKTIHCYIQKWRELSNKGN